MTKELKLKWNDKVISNPSKNRILPKSMEWLIAFALTQLTCDERESSKHFTNMVIQTHETSD